MLHFVHVIEHCHITSSTATSFITYFWPVCINIISTPAFGFDAIGLRPTVGTGDKLLLVGRPGSLSGSFSFSSNVVAIEKIDEVEGSFS